MLGLLNNCLERTAGLTPSQMMNTGHLPWSRKASTCFQGVGLPVSDMAASEVAGMTDVLWQTVGSVIQVSSSKHSTLHQVHVYWK